MLGLVREQRRAGDVADRVDAGHTCAVQCIDRDRGAIALHADLFQTEVLDVAGYPDGGDDALHGNGLRRSFAVVDRGGDAVGLLVELRDFRTGKNLDALLLELLAREGGDLGILRR